MQFRFHEASRHCKCQFSKQTVIVAIIAQTVKLHCAISLSANAMGSPSLFMSSQKQCPTPVLPLCIHNICPTFVSLLICCLHFACCANARRAWIFTENWFSLCSASPHCARAIYMALSERRLPANPWFPRFLLWRRSPSKLLIKYHVKFLILCCFKFQLFTLK